MEECKFCCDKLGWDRLIKIGDEEYMCGDCMVKLVARVIKELKKGGKDGKG